MNAYTEASDFGVTSGTRRNWVSLTETYWGYVIRSDSNFSTRAALIERVSAITGLTFLVLAGGHWVFPELHASVDGIEVRTASTIAPALVGLIFLWISGRGLSHELQVDMTLRCLRQVVRNRNGRSRIEKLVPFDQVDMAYVKRPEAAGAAARLVVRLKDSKVEVQMATGQLSTMQALNERMSRDIRPVDLKVTGWQRVGRKLIPNETGTLSVAC